MSDPKTNDALDENQADQLFSGADAAKLDDRHHRRVLTMKTIEAHPERAFTMGRRVPLCLWTGIAHGVTETHDPDKPEVKYLAMAGEFEALVYQDADPDKFRQGPSIRWYGGLCFLPGGFQESALSRMSVMEPDALRDPGFVFGLEFWAEPRSGKGTNYSYIARPMTREVTTHDRLALLRLEADRVVRIRAQNLLLETKHGFESKSGK